MVLQARMVIFCLKRWRQQGLDYRLNYLNYYDYNIFVYLLVSLEKLSGLRDNNWFP